MVATRAHMDALVDGVRASILAQWHAGGGGVLERSSQGSEQRLALCPAAREAFTVVQTAAALDVHQLGVLRALRELNGSAEEQPSVDAAAAPPAVDRYADDDHSDGSAAQGALVSSNVREGKPEEEVSAAGEYRAPDGSLRLVQDGLLSAEAAGTRSASAASVLSLPPSTLSVYSAPCSPVRLHSAICGTRR